MSTATTHYLVKNRKTKADQGTYTAAEAAGFPDKKFLKIPVAVPTPVTERKPTPAPVEAKPAKGEQAD
jgi:hypothetical protein